MHASYKFLSICCKHLTLWQKFLLTTWCYGKLIHRTSTHMTWYADKFKTSCRTKSCLQRRLEIARGTLTAIKNLNWIQLSRDVQYRTISKELGYFIAIKSRRRNQNFEIRWTNFNQAFHQTHQYIPDNKHTNHKMFIHNNYQPNKGEQHTVSNLTCLNSVHAPHPI